jgi:hypothetical protein
MSKKSTFFDEGEDYMLRTIDYEDTGSSGFKPKKNDKGKAIGHVLLKPLDWLSDSVKWLTNPTAKGGAKYAIKALAVSCFLLTTENTYQLFAGQEAVRFIPKPMVRDGADISRVLPLGDAGNAAIGALVAGANLFDAKLENPEPFRKTDLLIWADSRFYMALVLALFLNGVEAIILRQVSLRTRKTQLQNAQKTDQEISSVMSFADQAADFERLETKVRKQQVKQFGNGRLLTLGTLLAACYGFEGWSFFASAAPGTPFIISTILAVASIFGAEWLWVLAEYMESRDSEDEPTK